MTRRPPRTRSSSGDSPAASNKGAPSRGRRPDTPAAPTRDGRSRRNTPVVLTGPARMSVDVVRTASKIVAAAIAGTRPVDQEIAKGLAETHKLDDESRGHVVFLVGRALRRRPLYEAALLHLPYDARREALVLAALVDSGRLSPLPDRDVMVLQAALDAARAAVSSSERVRLESPVPAWLADRLRAVVPDDEVPLLMGAFADDPPLTLRANTLLGDRVALQARLLAEGIPSSVTTLTTTALVVDERRPVHKSKTFREGFFEIQDEGSQVLASLTDAAPGQIVVDGCAGAGGKTLALAAMMKGSGTLYAFDINARRLSDLGTRAKRAQVHNLRIHELDTRGVGVRKRLAGKADVVLVDAPCSGSGTLRRAPDIGWRLDVDTVTRLVDTQNEILDAYAPLLKPGGRLVYATCSLLGEENEAVAKAFQERWPQFRAVSVDDRLPKNALGPSTGQVRLSPHRHGTDGFFAAVFQRTDEL